MDKINAAIDDYFSDAVSLEVTIVADPERSFDRLDDAMYLAQASQEGSGNTEEQARPSAPLSNRKLATSVSSTSIGCRSVPA